MKGPPKIQKGAGEDGQGAWRPDQISDGGAKRCCGERKAYQETIFSTALSLGKSQTICPTNHGGPADQEGYFSRSLERGKRGPSFSGLINSSHIRGVAQRTKQTLEQTIRVVNCARKAELGSKVTTLIAEAGSGEGTGGALA